MSDERTSGPDGPGNGELSHGEREGPGGKRKRILIVDDSPLMLDMAREALENAGFQVFIAQTLSELSEFQDDRSLDLILMDVQMPEIFGDDVAMVLREVRGVPTPIYLLSSLPADELSERANEAEIEGYICKRDGIEALVARVTEILDKPDGDR